MGAINVLELFGTAAGEAAPVLIEVLRDNNKGRTGVYAAEALAAMGDQWAVPALAEVCNKRKAARLFRKGDAPYHYDEERGAAAAAALNRLQPDGARAADHFPLPSRIT